MQQRLRSEGIVLAPALLAVGLLVYWAAHGGGYAATTWQPSALVLLGLLTATVVGIGSRNVRLTRPAALALAALAGYVAWSYLSIAWAAAPGDALDGSNRALLYLLLFALFAVLPWRPWTAFATLAIFAVAVGTLALVTLVRLDTGGVAELFADGRLVYPLGYVNGAAALFTTGAIVSIAVAARRELPLALRPLLLGLAAAGSQAAVLCASRGWLFSLPIVLVLAVALVPGRVRLALWALPPIGGTLLALPALLDVFERVDAAPSEAAAERALADAAAHAAAVALPICVAVVAIGVVLALLDRRVTLSARTVRTTNRAAAVVAAGAVLVGIAAGLAATDGRPDRAIGDYWDRSQGYQVAAPGSSRFALAGSNRPDFWRVALAVAGEHPVGGLGQDNWGDAYLRDGRTSEQPRWTHSLELRLLAHTGIVGLLLFAAFAAAASAAALRGRGRAGLASAAAATALLPFVVWTVHGSVDWFWEIPALSGPAFAFLGLATAVMRTPGAPTLGDGRRPVLVATGVVAVLAGIVLALPYLAAREVARAAETWADEPAEALARLARARDLNPLSAQADLTAGVIALELHRPRLARPHLSAALRRDPGNWFALFARGLAASEAGDRRAARADLLRAQAFDPREPLIAEALERLDDVRPLTPMEAFERVRRDVQRLTGEDPGG